SVPSSGRLESDRRPLLTAASLSARAMKQETRDSARRWIGEAEKDIVDAELLLRHEGYYPLCRLAYLAAEKAMRAWLLEKGLEVSEQAGLAALSREVSSAEPALGSLIRSLHPLEQFAPPQPTADHEATSPSPPLYSREIAKQAIALARQAVTEVKRSLAAPS
ncbi:MAG: HEPN domain-containing protein, partial [Candidatus Methylomirabilaceae bacterium]